MTQTAASTALASDPRPGAARWRRWLLAFWSALATLLLGIASALVLFDPYDAGRLPSVLGAGVASQSPRLVRASQGRDPTVQAAILGNSHVQLLSPARLKAETGVPFVSLTVPGSGVGEKLALLGWFMRHRREPPQALVIGVDDFDCEEGPALLQVNPFPYWLYDPSLLGYATGLFNTLALGHSGERLLLRIRGRLAAPGDGYDDYEQGRTWTSWDPPAAPPPPSTPPAALAGMTFAGWERVRAAVESLPGEVPVVFVATPVHASRRPPAGSARDQRTRRCHDAIASFAAARGRTAFLDYRTNDPAWDDQTAFWDNEHIRRPIAERIEQDIARVLTSP